MLRFSRPTLRRRCRHNERELPGVATVHPPGYHDEATVHDTFRSGYRMMAAMDAPQRKARHARQVREHRKDSFARFGERASRSAPLHVRATPRASVAARTRRRCAARRCRACASLKRRRPINIGIPRVQLPLRAAASRPPSPPRPPATGGSEGADAPCCAAAIDVPRCAGRQAATEESLRRCCATRKREQRSATAKQALMFRAAPARFQHAAAPLRARAVAEDTAQRFIDVVRRAKRRSAQVAGENRRARCRKPVPAHRHVFAAAACAATALPPRHFELPANTSAACRISTDVPLARQRAAVMLVCASPSFAPSALSKYARANHAACPQARR